MAPATPNARPSFATSATEPSDTPPVVPGRNHARIVAEIAHEFRPRLDTEGFSAVRNIGAQLRDGAVPCDEPAHTHKRCKMCGNVCHARMTSCSSCCLPFVDRGSWEPATMPRPGGDAYSETDSDTNSDDVDSEEDVNEEVTDPAAPAVDPEAARIADMVDEIKDYMKLLYVKREMNFNEVRLTLAIEDPRLADRRERYGIEDESGVSADEKVEALELIDNGGVPTDALVVETLLADFRQWPGLDSEVRRDRSGSSRYAEIANQAAGIKTQIEDERRKLLMDDDDGDEKDGNPFGFLVLYGVSAVPIFITIAALSIMFVNSLQ